MGLPFRSSGISRKIFWRRWLLLGRLFVLRPNEINHLPATTSKPKASFETQQLRKGLRAALNQTYPGTDRRVGSFTCGVYAFFDYDNEPIYVGQTFEGLSSRIGRHLTNQRTDAVAMSVLDPFEVCHVELYPLVKHDGVKRKHASFPQAKSELNQLELAVFRKCISGSKFQAILNEKNPAPALIEIDIPVSVKACIVSEEVRNLRAHPDVRIARRAQTISRLAQVISERQVNVGLRHTLLTQAKRLEHLANQQLLAWGGESAVPRKDADEIEEDNQDAD